MVFWKFKKERRSYSSRSMWIALVLAIVCYIIGISTVVTLANAHTDANAQVVMKTTGVESLAEHVVVIVSLLAGTFTVVAGLIGYIFIGGQRATRRDISELKTSTEKGIDELKLNIKDLYEKKLDEKVHTQLCSILQLIKKGNGP